MGITLTPRQREAQSLLTGKQRHTLLFGGSRSGKTFVLVRSLCIRALRASGSRHVIFRLRANAAKTSLWLDTIPTVLSRCWPGIPARLHEVDRFIELPNGSEIWVAGLDDKQRVEKILGMEFATIYFNETSQIPYSSIVLAQSRLAQKVDGLKNRAYYDLNPVGKGHWTYQQFISKLKPGTRELIADPENYQAMFLNPRDNAANIDAEYIQALESLPERQRKRFLEGQYVDEIDGQLWTLELIEAGRVAPDDIPRMERIVIAVDPSGCSGDADTRSDEIGIAAVGKGIDGHYYMLEDATGRYSPEQWGRATVGLFKKWKADRVIGERNYGGDMVRATIQNVDRNIPFLDVVASRGKAVRAEPVAALYERGMVHHAGRFEQLEEQLSNFSTAGYMGLKSPNNADALVWGVTELAGGNAWGILDLMREQAEAVKSQQPVGPSTDPIELGDAQKRDSLGWANALRPAGLNKVAKGSNTRACTSCGSLGISVFSEIWRCGACGTTGSL